MQSSRRAAAAAITLSLALGGGITVAHADDTTVLYVDGSSASCADSGTGTEAAPYCTIQAAANAAAAGDTVDIEAGAYKGPVTITSQGTAAAPIVFQPVGGHVSLLLGNGETGPVLSFNGASYVTFEGGWTGYGTQDMLLDGAIVSGSSHVTLDELELSTVEATGTSTDVTISRNWVRGGSVKVDAGGSGDIVSTNWVQDGTISVTDAANTAITSNTVQVNGSTADTISVAGASTGVTVENNIAAYPGAYSGTGAEIGVDAAAAAGTTADYNVVWPYPDDFGSAVGAAYSWAGVDYASPAALYAATGQGRHDLEADPSLNPAPYPDVSTAPQNNSANSAAPGMLDTDMYGNPCTGDPIVAVTGSGTPAYCARGAAQPVYTTTLSASATAVNALSVSLNSGVNQTVYVGGSEQLGVSVDAPPAATYTVNWGDGTTSTAATHTYAKTGTYTITDTADFTNGTTAVATTSFTTAGSGYTPYGPVRLLDTRKGLGAAKAKIPGGSRITLKVAGVGSIPTDVTAVAVNLTVTDTTANGYISANEGDTTASTSNLNYGAGQTVANSTIVPVDSDGTIELANGGPSSSSADLIADVSGYFTQATGDGYTPVPLSRFLDTRSGIGAAKAKIAGGGHVSLAIAGVDSIPAGVKAVAVHVTEVDATAVGWIAAEADGAGTPGTSILDYGAGQTISNTLIVPVAADGRIELYNGASSGSVDLLADVSGYFSATSTQAYLPLDAFRAFDSRDEGELNPDSINDLSLADWTTDDAANLIPAGATVITNITITGAQASGYLTVYPVGAARPGVSDLNFFAGQTVANLGLLATSGPDQTVNVYNHSTAYDELLLDVFGYFANS